MDRSALNPHGRGMLAYWQGDAAAELVIRREDGFEFPLPVSIFFRPPAEFVPIEVAALERCRGDVLDVGAGSGLHSLVLQSWGMRVTAIDISAEAVEVMVGRGVRDAQVADVFEFRGGPFDTLLMLGHGIGVVEDLDGLDRFLLRARELTRDDGQVLLHSLDVCKTEDPVHLAYHEATRRAGRYVGETRIQVEFRGQCGEYGGWLHVDPRMLAERAERAGWGCEVVREEETGDYLGCLTR